MADAQELETIRMRLSLVEAASAHTQLKKSGVRHKGLCPFHTEKTPSFTIDEGKGLWHCFGCGEGGDIFTFMMKAENLTFGEAVERLARRAGVVLKPRREVSPEERSIRDRMLKANERAAKYYHKILLDSQESQRFLSYLERRQIGSGQIEEFLLGAAHDSWDDLAKTFVAEGFSAADLEKAGLVLSRDTGGHYDRFRGRLIFPLRNVTGDVVGFAGRAMGDETPKYINTPQSPVFDKGRLLYGLDHAKRHIVDSSLILTEGYTDVIALHRAGIRNAVASMGTALTEFQVEAVRRYCTSVFLAYDSDIAGDAATLRGIEMMIERGLDLRVVSLPAGKDPDSIVCEGGGGAFKLHLEQARRYFDYFTERAIAKHGIGTPEGQREVILAVAPIIEKSQNPLLQDHQKRALAERLGLEEKDVRAVLFSVRPQRHRKADTAAEKQIIPTALAMPEKKIISILLSNQENANKILDDLSPEHFSYEYYRSLFTYCYRYRTEKGDFKPDVFLCETHPQEMVRLLGGITLAQQCEDESENVDECITHLKTLAKQRKIRALKKMVEQAERDGNRDLVLKLVRQAEELKKELF
ncbi:MAG: DNA primase [bacterium]